MNVIRRHKWLAIISSLTLILIIIMFAIFSKMIFSNGDSEYGERLSGIIKVDKNITKEIIKETKENENVEDIEIRTQGKIIYMTIEFKAGTKLETAKEIAQKTITKYDQEITNYYDFGYFLKENIVDDKETDEIEKGFISTGTKHPDNDKISWTK